MIKAKIYKLVASIVLVSAISFSTSNANGQRRSSKNEKLRYEERNKTDRLRKYDGKEKYNRSNYSSGFNQDTDRVKKKHQKYNSQHKQQKYAKKSSNSNVDRKGKQKSFGHNSRAHKSYRHWDSRPKVRQHSHRQHKRQIKSQSRYRHFYDRHGHTCYHHDRYGNVLIRFANEPLIISHPYGNYYFTNGVYYRFYKEVGYVLVDAPSSTYFSYVPHNCKQVRHQAGVYYTNGEICFVKHKNAYRLVKVPTNLQFSLHF